MPSLTKNQAIEILRCADAFRPADSQHAKLAIIKQADLMRIFGVEDKFQIPNLGFTQYFSHTSVFAIHSSDKSNVEAVAGMTLEEAHEKLGRIGSNLTPALAHSIIKQAESNLDLDPEFNDYDHLITTYSIDTKQLHAMLGVQDPEKDLPSIPCFPDEFDRTRTCIASYWHDTNSLQALDAVHQSAKERTSQGKGPREK